MKDGYEATATERTHEPEEFTNRKLIRPSLSKVELRRPEPASGGAPNHNQEMPTGDVPERRRTERPERRKSAAAPEQTNAENFYYQKQMQTRTPIVVVLTDGEEIQGTIDWYDKTCIKLSRGSANLLVYKSNIRYLYKLGDNARR